MKGDREMRHMSFLRSPKKEEQQLVPENYHEIGNLEDIKGFLGINNIEAQTEEDEQQQQHQNLTNNIWSRLLEENEDVKVCKTEDINLAKNSDNFFGEHEFFGWDISNWENEESLFQNHQEYIIDNNNANKEEDLGSCYGFWDENVMEDTKATLNLNLNYEEVLEAWSDRGPLWAHNHQTSLSISNNTHYMGEVPNLEDEKTRRETSVLRYKEKRHSRLFSKKIRYEVRKLNADKRPRLKGRFVKRISNAKNEKMSNGG